MKKLVFYFAILFAGISYCNAQQMIKDIWPGVNGSYPFYFINLTDSLALFAASDSIYGNELWITDGTTSGTFMMKDLNSGVDGSWLTFIDTIGGKVLFFAETNAAGRELWVTDGTPAGTTMLGDINPGGGDAFIYDIIVGHANNKVFIVADQSPNGTELYATNGTPGGTALVKDICVGAGNGLGSYNDHGVAAGNYVYFSSYGSSCSDRELWKSDGTAIGTTMIKSFGNFPYGMRKNWDNIMFGVYESVYGTEIWTSDGTIPGTVIAGYGDIYSGATGSYPGYMLQTSSNVFFTANNGVTGREWYSFSSGYVYAVDELVPGPSGPIIDKVFSPKPAQNVLFGFFSANDFIHGNELYIASYYDDVTLLKDINPSGNSNPDNFSYIDYYRIFFTADDGVHGTELWVTDGSPSGTRRLTDIIPGWQSSLYSSVCLANNKLVFGANDGIHGYELFSVDYSTILGIGTESASSAELTTYPNPVNDELNLDLPEVLNENVYVSIWNNTGQEVMQIPLSAYSGKSFRLNVSALVPGIYIGTLNTDQIAYKFRVVKM